VVPTAPADNRNHPLYAVGNTMHAQVSAISVLRRTALWDSATVLAEVGWQRSTSITKNPNAFSPNRERSAWGFRMLFAPTYFQVLTNLDLSLPIALAYNPKGKSPIAGFNGGAHKGGTISLGISAEYLKAWTAALQFTHYYGGEDFQTLKDRDFIAFSLQRTF
jgi:hypothetical protein